MYPLGIKLYFRSPILLPLKIHMLKIFLKGFYIALLPHGQVEPCLYIILLMHSDLFIKTTIHFFRHYQNVMDSPIVVININCFRSESNISEIPNLSFDHLIGLSIEEKEIITNNQNTTLN
jgi:hypothetical protein